jgi:hypothetical protein
MANKDEILVGLLGHLSERFRFNETSDTSGYFAYRKSLKAHSNYTFTISLFEGKMCFIISFESYGRSNCHNKMRSGLIKIENSTTNTQYSITSPNSWRCELDLGDPDLQEKARDVCWKVINIVSRSRIK